MAKTARDDLFDRLRTGGLRKKVAKATRCGHPPG